MSAPQVVSAPRPARWLAVVLIVLVLVGAVLANVWAYHERRVGAASRQSGDPGFRVDFLEDPRGALSLAEASAAGARFVPLAEKPAHPPIVWYRLTIAGPAKQPGKAVLALSNDFTLAATLFQPQPEGGFRTLRAGSTIRWFRRPIQTSKVAFPLTLAADRDTVLFVRVDDPIKQPASFQLWDDPETFRHLTDVYKLGYAGYFSLWFGLFAYNGILYAFLRRRDYLLYLLYMLSLGVLLLTTSDVVTLFVPWPAWPLRGIVGMLALNLSVFTLAQFSRAFLDTSRGIPEVDRWLRAIGWLALALCLGLPGWLLSLPGFAWWHSAVEIGTCTLLMAALPLVGLALWIRRTPQSGLYVLAFLPLVAGFVYVMHGSPGLPDGRSSSMPALTGSGAELVLLAMALAWRYRRVIDERDRLLADYTGRLEREVADRTRQLRDSNDSLARANRDKDRIFGILGHDLRAPAQQLAGLSRLMAEAPEIMPAKDAANLAQDIEEGCRAQLELLDTLILWGRAQARVDGTAAAGTSAADIAQAAAAAHAPAARRKGIELRVDLAADMAVAADAPAAQAVLRNLIGNAVKFTRAGGTVAVRAYREGDSVHLCVTDNGVGIPPERLEAVLSGPVRSQAGTQSETGSGIGLAICRDLARSQGGDLSLASEPGRGTTATLMLRSAS